MSDKSRFLKQKNVGTILVLNFSYTSHYKTCWHIVFLLQKGYRECKLKSEKNKKW